MSETTLTDGPAVELIQKSAAKAVDAKSRAAVLELPGPGDEYAVVTSDGDIEYRQKEPPLFAAKIDSVDQIQNAIDLWKPAVIFVELHRVTGTLSSTDHREAFQCVLTMTEEFQSLPICVTHYTQAELIKLLRFTLAGCLNSAGDAMLEWARSIDVREMGQTTSVSRSDRESLGRSVAAEIADDNGPMPVEFIADVRVHDDRVLTVRRPVRVMVDFSPRDQRFSLKAVADDVQAALDNEAEQIESIARESASTNADASPREKPVPVIMGSPA